jgi:hypothetical protein
MLHFTGAPHTVKTGKRMKISKKVFIRWLEGTSLDSQNKLHLDKSIQENTEETSWLTTYLIKAQIRKPMYGSPCRIRTCDHSVNSRALYH